MGDDRRAIDSADRDRLVEVLERERSGRVELIPEQPWVARRMTARASWSTDDEPAPGADERAAAVDGCARAAFELCLPGEREWLDEEIEPMRELLRRFADVASMESWADLYAEADMERAQLRRERARLWVALDLTMQVLDPKRDPPAEDHGEIVAIGRAALSCAGVEPTGEDR